MFERRLLIRFSTGRGGSTRSCQQELTIPFRCKLLQNFDETSSSCLGDCVVSVFAANQNTNAPLIRKIQIRLEFCCARIFQLSLYALDLVHQASCKRWLYYGEGTNTFEEGSQDRSGAIPTGEGRRQVTVFTAKSCPMSKLAAATDEPVERTKSGSTA